MQLLLATANPHKLDEIRDLLADIPELRLLSLRDFPELQLPPEDGLTMRDNARLKAAYCTTHTGLPALADDSGIEVDALHGEPGLFSARWLPGSDADRMYGLLDRLQDAPGASTARYRCAITLTRAGGEPFEVEATCEGRIIGLPRGSNGFGYDPIFEITAGTGAPPEWIGRTMAEAPPALKARISHRARAVLAVKPKLREWSATL